MPEQPLDPECVHCRDRLANLERLAVAHGAHLATHDADIAMLMTTMRDLRKLIEAAELKREVRDARTTSLLEQILSVVTPSAK